MYNVNKIQNQNKKYKKVLLVHYKSQIGMVGMSLRSQEIKNAADQLRLDRQFITSGL